MALISLIVPVYKVEKYLDRCIQSLVKQTLKDIEIILVDDGSPDSCPQLCDDWKRRDSRIQVIHKDNGGLSSARNAGLEIAKGKYIGFIDSDDDVEINMFQIMVEAAEKFSVDFVMSDYIRVLQDGTEKLVSTNLKSGLYKKEDIIQRIYPSLIMGENVDYGPILSVWHCIYSLEFLMKNNIKFAEDVKWSEDNLFNAIVGYYASSFFYLKGKGLYHYYQNFGTITTSYRPGAWNIYKKMNDYLEEFFVQKQEYNFKRQLQLHIIYYACNTIGMECKNANSIHDAKNRIKVILYDSKMENAFYNFKIPCVSLKLRIQLWLMKHKCAGILAIIIGGL